jgi:hypothetical protein
MSRFFGFLVVLSRGQVFKAFYFIWSILSIILCLPLDELCGNALFLAELAGFNDTLYILVEGFFSFIFNEWREDVVLLCLL